MNLLELKPEIQNPHNLNQQIGAPQQQINFTQLPIQNQIKQSVLNMNTFQLPKGNIQQKLTNHSLIQKQIQSPNSSFKTEPKMNNKSVKQFKTTFETSSDLDNAEASVSSALDK
ncbi:Hypothetical_protein [Hexamita inflata]|uniref:Hypothetical_protein n=1 Tax=Hexamita inflata TaxID=28002 RepID=A0ABP1J515_9EUKA